MWRDLENGENNTLFSEVNIMALYSDTVMEHFRHPRNVGVIEDADGVGEVGNAKCGDIMKIYLKIDDDVVTTSSLRPSAAAAPSRPAPWRRR